MNYLLAARASDRLEEPERVAEFLQRAEEAEPAAASAAEIVRLENKLRAGEYDQAQALLAQSKNNLSKLPYVMGLMQQVYEGQGDWESLLALLPDLRKQKQIGEEEATELERQAQRHRLKGATDIHGVWQGLSSDQKQDSEMLQLYVSRLIKMGDSAGAQKTIERALKRQWDSSMVRQYGFLDGENVSARLSRAERWLSNHAEDPELLLTLGRLCLQDKLWGKARDYFESSYRADPSAEVCAELGRLLVALGEPTVAAAYYREGLSRSETALPALPLPEETV